MRTTKLLIPLLFAAGCAASAPDDPTWVDDVQPILVANCVRCHGMPPANAAPNYLRLDKYASTTLAAPITLLDGTVITEIPGAAQSNANVVLRAVTAGDMPPAIGLTDAQKQTLQNWQDRAPDPDHPRLGERPGNQDPDLTADSLPSSASASDTVDLTYAISDPDGDLVDGTVLLRPATGDDIVVADALHDGRGTASLILDAAPPGTYDVIVSLTDDLATVERNLGSLDVTQ